MDGALISYKPSAEQLSQTVGGSRGQVANAAENFVSAPWNDLAALESIVDAHAGRRGDRDGAGPVEQRLHLAARWISWGRT
jgi:hypothetical protein